MDSQIDPKTFVQQDNVPTRPFPLGSMELCLSRDLCRYLGMLADP